MLGLFCFILSVNGSLQSLIKKLIQLGFTAFDFCVFVYVYVLGISCIYISAVFLNWLQYVPDWDGVII